MSTSMDEARQQVLEERQAREGDTSPPARMWLEFGDDPADAWTEPGGVEYVLASDVEALVEMKEILEAQRSAQTQWLREHHPEVFAGGLMWDAVTRATIAVEEASK